MEKPKPTGTPGGIWYTVNANKGIERIIEGKKFQFDEMSLTAVVQEKKKRMNCQIPGKWDAFDISMKCKKR